MASKRALLSLRTLNSRPSPCHSVHLPPLTRSAPRALPCASSTVRLQRRWKSTTNDLPSPASATTSATTHKSPAQPSPQPIKPYNYEDVLTPRSPPRPNPLTLPSTQILTLTHSPTPHTLLIDVRTPAETAQGRIPTAQQLNITAHPDGLFLSAEEFEERFGWEKPSRETELVFYCKAGVRSRVAARMAREAGWKAGEYAGSWDDWVGRGGGVERG
ncbi:hypothetical protein MMC11_006108 [Xylographa trunciseda]|nr:hypothetical protein [Xylographa trunciseda]